MAECGGIWDHEEIWASLQESCRECIRYQILHGIGTYHHHITASLTWTDAKFRV